MRILYSGFIDPAHSSYGGYHGILRYPGCAKALLTSDYPLGTLDKKFHLRKIPYWLMDLDTRIRRRNYDITHLFYGEVTMFPYMRYRKDTRHKTVITLHLDIEKQHNYKHFIKALPAFDGIIVLSTQQQAYYREKHGIETTFIPHGFDTPLFSRKLPKDENGKEPDPSKINLTTCGKNYRDFDTLLKVIAHFEHDSRFHFHLAGTPAGIKEKARKFSNVSIYPHISDDEYYSLIEASDYSFLPVLFATANNALLEAQALGVRSILPSVPGILDYAAPDNLFYGGYDSLLSTIDGLGKSGAVESIRRHAGKFQWVNIFKQLDEFYANLFRK